MKRTVLFLKYLIANPAIFLIGGFMVEISDGEFPWGLVYIYLPATIIIGSISFWMHNNNHNKSGMPDENLNKNLIPSVINSGHTPADLLAFLLNHPAFKDCALTQNKMLLKTNFKPHWYDPLTKFSIIIAPQKNEGTEQIYEYTIAKEKTSMNSLGFIDKGTTNYGISIITKFLESQDEYQ